MAFLFVITWAHCERHVPDPLVRGVCGAHRRRHGVLAPAAEILYFWETNKRFANKNHKINCLNF